MLPLEDLGDDVCLLILSLCDIETVLFMRRVNTFFRQLTKSKQLWISLVEDLVSKALLDLPHTRPLIHHSVEELIALVKRAVVGPATWSQPESSPALAEKISLPKGILAGARNVELLPGGRHVLVRGYDYFELWNVKGKTPIWTRDFNTSATRVVEMVNRGRSLVLCLSQRRGITVIQVNLETGESHVLLKAHIPDIFRLEKGIIALAGDFLVVAVYWQTGPIPSYTDAVKYNTTWAFLLVDWRLQKYVLIPHPRPMSLSGFVPTVAFASGHIIFTMMFDKIVMYRLAAFASHWRPINSMNIDDLVDWRSEVIAPAVVARLEDFPCIGPVDQLHSPELILYKSPLRCDGYKLIVLHSGTVHDKAFSKAPFRVMLTYRFAIARDTGVLEGWNRTSAIQAGTTTYRGRPSITYAGYGTENFEDYPRVVDLRRPGLGPGAEATPIVLNPEEEFRTMFSGYSHACLHRRDSGLVVSYYV